MQVHVHGLAPREGDAAFAFLVLRLAPPVDRAGLIELIQHIAPLLPDAERFVAELPDPDDAAMRLVGIPWSPPEAGHAFDMQRRLIEGAALHGIEEVWFFQTGTSLPAIDDDDDDDNDDDDDDDDDDARDASDVQIQTTLLAAMQRPVTDDSWGDLELGGDPGTPPPMHHGTTEQAPATEPGDDDDVTSSMPADNDDDAVWSYGPPPQALEVRFPVDGYPAIIDELDWEDFGIAFKLAGPWTPGESTVLLGFHAMWLVPYGGRYRNAAVTIDQRHHAAHLWVDRFAVPCSSREQVHHLLWVVSKLDEVIPIVHARFCGATLAQKYGGVLGDTSEPFVLGGNPLIAVHTAGGARAVDAWIAAQTQWSSAELAQMLRELAIELVTGRDRSPEAGDPEDVGETGGSTDQDDVDAMFEAAGIGVVDEGDAGERVDDQDNAVGETEASDDHELVRSRRLTTYAGELLTARARTGTLDPRVADRLRPVLAVSGKDEHRRAAVVSILGALRDRDSVPAMIRLIEDTPIASSLDAIGKAALVTATVAALGAIADPAAVPVLSKVVSALGAHDDEPRAAATSALAACLAAAPGMPEPDALDDAMFVVPAGHGDGGAVDHPDPDDDDRVN